MTVPDHLQQLARDQCQQCRQDSFHLQQLAPGGPGGFYADDPAGRRWYVVTDSWLVICQHGLGAAVQIRFQLAGGSEYCSRPPQGWLFRWRDLSGPQKQDGFSGNPGHWIRRHVRQFLAEWQLAPDPQVDGPLQAGDGPD